MAHQDILESALGEWTSARDPYDVMTTLQAAGVPAGVVQNTAELVDRDPSLRRRHWEYLDHPDMGRALYDGPPFRLSRTRNRLRSPAPRLGEHTDTVLRDELGLTAGEIDEYRRAGVLT